MKRFGSLFLAAVLGSVSTVATLKWFDDSQHGVKLEYVVPTSNVSYNKTENGQSIGPDFAATAERVTPAVVYIKSTQEAGQQRELPQGLDPFKEFFGPQQQGPSQSSGSGVIINENGYIVTNNHVVKDADIVEVTLYDNRTIKAEVIGTDPDTDLAIIKINQTGLPYLSFVDSDQSRVGEWVLAVGNPFNLNSTVTAGIISAKGRSINILNNSSQKEKGNTAIESFIQTDAAINPGNSGGALVNLGGGLLGINTAIASPTGSYSGYGFAVPSNIVSKIVEDLIKFGTVQRGWLGVSIGSVNSDLVKEHDLKVNEGAYVQGLAEKSSAKEAGIKEGDVIIKINDSPIKTNSALIENVGRHRPGDKLEILVNRSGKEITFPVILKNKEGKTDVVKAEDRDSYGSLGFEIDEVDSKILKKLDLQNGVIVKAVGNGKIGKSTDMREGFIISKVNDIPVKSVKELNELLKKKKAGDLVILSGTYEDFPREFNYAFRM